MSACGMTPPRPKKSQGNLLSWLQDIYLYTYASGTRGGESDPGHGASQMLGFIYRGQNSDRGGAFLPQRFFIGLGHSCGAKIAIEGVHFCLRGFS